MPNQPVDIRQQQCQAWLQSLPDFQSARLVAITHDASFRRYFRVEDETGITRIVMDAPPDKEPVQAFLHVAALLRQAGLSAPEIFAQDQQQGFLVLSDFGDDVYLAKLAVENLAQNERLYGDALSALNVMQVCIDAEALPAYDQVLLHREMNLFPDWYVAKHLNMSLDASQKQVLADCFEQLSTNALAQPQVFVHRDYHARNLLYYPSHNPAIIDFQDAVYGAITYDLVSLLRDAYRVLPQAEIIERVKGYYKLSRHSGLLGADSSEAEFIKWFDWMGLQRHLKVVGIFARLYHRDGKSGYLEDIPTVMQYLLDVSAQYDEMADLHNLLLDLG